MFVHERLDEITELYLTYFDILHRLIRDEDGGNSFAAFRIWGPGKTAKVQCDFSTMISPRMFREFVSPYLERQCKRLDYSVYHLDGIGALHNLDLLLKINDLNAIQWTAGIGMSDPGSKAWFPMYRKILSAGKSLLLIDVPPLRIKNLVRSLDKKRLFIISRTTSQKDAQKFLKQNLS